MINYNVSKIISKLGERGISAADCMQTEKVNSSLEKRIELHSGFLHSNFFLKVLENWQIVVKICQVDNVMYQNI